MNAAIKKARAPNLTEDKVVQILQIVDGWEGSRLTWDALIESIEARMQATYTRQALAKHQRIQLAYETKNKILATSPKKSASKGIPELDEAMRVIERQRAEIERLKQGETNFLEQFARWAHNAVLEGIDYRLLDRPIESVNRDPSESYKKVSQLRKGK